MEQAKIVNDENVILSVDDLIMRIGVLTVEKMELEKKYGNVAKIEEKYVGLQAREKDLIRQLNDLSVKYNEIVELLNEKNLKIAELEKQLEKTNALYKTKKRD